MNHLALAEREGIHKLFVYDDEHSSWNSLADRPLQKYGIAVKPVGTEEVTATTIDAYCEKTGVSHIDLLKIDVEGGSTKCCWGHAACYKDRQSVAVFLSLDKRPLTWATIRTKSRPI